MKKAFICGAAGTTGLELRYRLMGMSEIEMVELPYEERRNEEAIAEAMAESDVTFLCLPDDAARSIAAMAPTDTVVIDTSTAHRVAEGWTYGFPELSLEQKTAIASAKRIANPGCHATGFISLVAPLTAAGLLAKDTRLTSYSLTGYSGGGKKMIAEYESTERPLTLDAPRHYALALKHKHLPEMKKYCGLDYAPLFEPIVGSFYRGMAVTVPLFSQQLGGASLEDVMAVLEKHYADTKRITVGPALEDGFLPTNMLMGQDNLHICVRGSGDMISLTAVFDNLGKGASGAAVQNMCLALGLDE